MIVNRDVNAALNIAEVYYQQSIDKKHVISPAFNRANELKRNEVDDPTPLRFVPRGKRTTNQGEYLEFETADASNIQEFMMEIVQRRREMLQIRLKARREKKRQQIQSRVEKNPDNPKVLKKFAVNVLASESILTRSYR